MSITLARRIVEDAGRSGFSYLRLTGGEPFLYPHLEEILSLATSSGYFIEIETDEEELGIHINMLKPYNIMFLAFSLSGANSQTHDFIRGRGSFEKTMNNIELAKKNSFPVRIAYIIDNQNINEFYDAVSLIDRLNISWITINEVLPVGRSLENKLLITPQYIPCYFPFISTKLPGGKFKFASNHAEDYCNYVKGGNCFVNWNGEIALCSYSGFEKKVADLNSASFEEGLRSLSSFTTGLLSDCIEKDKKINCLTCSFSYHEKVITDKDVTEKTRRGVDWSALSHIKIPRAFNVLLTRKCNFNCNFCEFDCHFEDKSLDVDLLEKLLKEGARLRVREVIFDGGEPLIYEYFREALKLAFFYHYHITVLTNGWYFKDFLPLFKEYNVKRVIFGIDGASEKTSDEIKKKSGALRRVIEAVRLSKKSDFSTGLHLVLSACNYRELDQFLLLSQREAVDYVMISSLIPLGRAFNKPALQLKEEEKDSVRNIYDKYRSFLSRILFYGAYAKGSEQRRLEPCYYLNMALHLAIDWNGRLPLCALSPMYDLPFPSLHNNSLLECLIQLSEINRRFCLEREGEFLNYKPGKKYLSCEYCLDKLGEEPQKYFENIETDKLFSCVPSDIVL